TLVAAFNCLEPAYRLAQLLLHLADLLACLLRLTGLARCIGLGGRRLVSLFGSRQQALPGRFSRLFRAVPHRPAEFFAGLLNRLAEILGGDPFLVERFGHLFRSLVQGLGDLVADRTEVLAQSLTKILQEALEMIGHILVTVGSVTIVILILSFPFDTIVILILSFPFELLAGLLGLIAILGDEFPSRPSSFIPMSKCER